MAVDLVCEMDVDEATAKFTSEYKGKTYYFCAPGVQEALRARPGGLPEGGVRSPPAGPPREDHKTLIL